MINWIGWVATAVFAVSYFCRQPAAMRRVQALAALLWIGYGVIIKAPPVIVANTVVAAMAIISSSRSGKSWTSPVKILRAMRSHWVLGIRLGNDLLRKFANQKGPRRVF